MRDFCVAHQKEHESHYWKTFFTDGGKQKQSYCGAAMLEQPLQDAELFHIGVSKVDARLGHWKSIKQRVRTHEGELLSGKNGEKYKKKYSRQYLGRDMSAPTNFSHVEYQKELRLPTKEANKR